MSEPVIQPLTEAEILRGRRRCRHFTGTQHERCARGVAYAEARAGGSLPCLPSGRTPGEQMEACPYIESRTREEVIQEHEELERHAAEMITRLSAFVDGEDRRCIHCDREVKSAGKVGRCVYAYPCGCRQYQGQVPDWARYGGRTRQL